MYYTSITPNDRDIPNTPVGYSKQEDGGQTLTYGDCRGETPLHVTRDDGVYSGRTTSIGFHLDQFHAVSTRTTGHTAPLGLLDNNNLIQIPTTLAAHRLRQVGGCCSV